MPSDNHELLKAEYLYIQNVIEAFDSRALTIKAWSITFSLVAVGVAHEEDSWLILVLAGLGSMLFWFLEATWKRFQDAYYERIDLLERYFAGSVSDVVPMQIRRSWYSAWKKGGYKRLWRIMWRHYVIFPHAFGVGFVLLLLLAREMGWLMAQGGL